MKVTGKITITRSVSDEQNLEMKDFSALKHHFGTSASATQNDHYARESKYQCCVSFLDRTLWIDVS